MPDLLSIITSSDKRKKLLLLLQHGPKTLEEMRLALNFTATGMLPQIRILEERNLVKQEGKQYALTEIGQMITGYLEPLVKTVEVIERQEEFWREHDAGAIPSNLLMKIGELGNTQIIESNIEELYEPHKEFLENISLILTRKAFDKIEIEYSEMLSRALSFKNWSLYVSDEDIRLACVGTDIFFSISLFFKNDAFDSRKDLVSFDKSALLWGEELFNYYKERSVKIENI